MKAIAEVHLGFAIGGMIKVMVSGDKAKARAKCLGRFAPLSLVENRWAREIAQMYAIATATRTVR